MLATCPETVERKKHLNKQKMTFLRSFSRFFVPDLCLTFQNEFFYCNSDSVIIIAFRYIVCMILQASPCIRYCYTDPGKLEHRLVIWRVTAAHQLISAYPQIIHQPKQSSFLARIRAAYLEKYFPAAE